MKNELLHQTDTNTAKALVNWVAAFLGIGTFLGVVNLAVGVLSAHLVYIPVGVAKCFPVQHAINVLLAALIGTRYSVGAAFGVAALRNILGTGSLLAFPGSMIGAALSGIVYARTQSIWGAVAGEIIEVNDATADEPELLNDDPHNEGWLVKIRMSNASDLKSLMKADQYEDYIKSGEA